MRKEILWKELLPLILVGLGGLAYLGTTVLSSSSKNERSIVRVNNSTHSCEVSAEIHNGRLKVRVQNNSKNGITAFMLTSRIDPSTVFTLKEEFAFSEGTDGVAPGDSYDKIISLPDKLSRQKEISVNLAAVLFADKSSEGNQKDIRDIEDNRLGEKIQLMKALSVLDKISGLSETDIGSYWSTTARHEFQVVLDAPNTELLLQLNNKASDVPIVESEQFRLGARAGKEYVLQKYQELRDIQEKQGAPALREGIIAVRDLYAKMMTRS